jgi:hypothetical protein
LGGPQRDKESTRMVITVSIERSNMKQRTDAPLKRD